MITLQQILKGKFGQVKAGANGWFNIPCPTCTPHDAKKMKRGVHNKTLATHCFICEVPLTYADLVGNIEFVRVQGNETIEIPEHPQAREYPFKQVIPINELNEKHPAVMFLNKDFLYRKDDYWNFQRIGYIDSNNGIDIRFNKGDRITSLNTGDSIIFPVFHDQVLVGWQIRYMNKPKLKYLHIFPKGKYLYNYDQAKKYDSIVVTEGVKKALKFPNGVATWGKCISELQIQMVQKWKKIAFCYDGEDETQIKTREIVKLINAGPRSCICIDPRDYGFKSPDEATEQQCAEALEDSWKKYDRRD